MSCSDWMMITFGLISSHDKIEFLKAVVKPLFRTISDADFKAMRFEKDIVEVSLAHLTGQNRKI